MIGLIIYIKLKPGTQMIPPFWKLETDSIFLGKYANNIFIFDQFKKLNIK